MEQNWRCLGQLTDRLILGTPGLSCRPPQEKVRAILLDSEGKLALMYEQAAGLYALPGGGIEPGETPHTALVRELAEETGCSCRQVQPLGIVTENRAYADTTRRTYFFLVQADAFPAAPQLTPEEQALGTSLHWLPPEEALSKIRDVVHTDPQKRFLQARDLAALNAWLSQG